MTGPKPTDPFERFCAIKDRQSTAAKKAQRSDELVWDPWPVRNVQKDAILEAAKKIVRQQNSKCINICTDKIVLLPASGNIPGVQSGSLETPLYSIRSPEFLPVRIHLCLFGVQLPFLR
ncbi:hypothetical protein ABVK25_011368 [Lepraria finkii]|uniref:Uncharacterized protein n=1 Tax=Lepraria finkii TaxID=1340010 RepID=A0ABR4AQC2_9LECA